ncbi:uncharacterized protein EHS24_005768 [Apiotrichum porosum]|uniref:Beta-lactamase-related domain-containing protein n=1 Tax=Apiotrichum porosum TaxID=105984 RepID=A0A427XZU0_9TREE|nr:uncharacterized protein EHS24_005768 [Apiotrichum porosum]RSH84255.1 hypothetical protein EHS24_005768 [Apiotrichum porosum]
MTPTRGTVPRLTPEGKARLDELVKRQVAESGLPALFFGATTADGEIYFNCGGDKVVNKPELGQVDEDTTVQLWSMTKMITAIACIQLHEKGLLTYDDPEVINKHAPELAAMPILTGFDDKDQPTTTPRTKPLTLRHLLTHTSGLAYALFNPTVAKWEQVTGAGSWLAPGAPVSTIVQPLLFEPGSKFCYGLGLDWAGVIVMRISGQTLEEYFHEHIFAPCGLTDDDISFLPNESIRSRLMQLCAPTPAGNIAIDGLRPVPELKPEDIGLQLGGGGLLGTPRGYMRVLSGLLKCRDQDGGIVSQEGFRSLFDNCLPPHSDTEAYKDLGQFLAFAGVTEPQYMSGDKVGWSLGLCLYTADSKYGRKAGTGFWSGVASTRHWIDPSMGIAAWCGTQLLGDFAPLERLTEAFEEVLYGALETGPN